MAKKRTSYHAILKQELSDLVDELDLPPLYKQSMKSRWLDQVLWTDKKATQCQKRYYGLRLTTVIGGVIIPALVAFNNFPAEENSRGQAFPISLFALTQVVAICTAIEEFFQYGPQWRQYRTTAESLKSEGWQYFQLSGAYRKAHNHWQAYGVFSTRVESIIRKDVQNYMSEVAKEQDNKQDEDNTGRQVDAVQMSPISSGFFTEAGGNIASPSLEPTPIGTPPSPQEGANRSGVAGSGAAGSGAAGLPVEPPELSIDIPDAPTPQQPGAPNGTPTRAAVPRPPAPPKPGSTRSRDRT